MKHLLPASILVLILVSIPRVLFSQVSVNASAEYVSGYYWRGFDFLDGNPAFQSLVTISHNNGFRLETFGSVAADQRDVLSDFDEIDFTAVYSTALNKVFTLDVAISLYNLVRYDDFPGGASTIWEPFVRINAGSIFNPGLSIFYNTNEFWGDGFFVEFGVAQPLLVSSKFQPEIAASIGYNDGSWGVKKAGISHVDLGVTLPVNLKNGFGAHVGIHEMILFSDELKELNWDKSSEFWFNIGFNVSF